MIRKFTDIEPKLINNDVAKGVSARVVIGKKDGAENFFMRVFQLAPGGNTPMHRHDWEHEMFFHEGTGEVFTGGKWVQAGPGNVVLVPGNEDHQVKNTGDSVLTMVCLVPSKAPEL